MKIYATPEAIATYFHTEVSAREYVGDEHALLFRKFEILVVIDLEDTAQMQQTILVEMVNPGERPEARMFDDAVLEAVEFHEIETGKYLINLLHSY